MGNLKQKTISGIFWTFGRLFSVQLATFIVQLFLARILLPQDFGLIAMLQIFIVIGQSLMDSGMSSSLIRTKNPDQKDYSTVFFNNLFVSVIVYFIIYFNAERISIFYDQPKLELIVKVYALSILIQALVSVQLAKLTKEMNFRLQMLLEIPAVVLSCVVGIWMALHDYGVWSLVWMQLSKTIIFTIQIWLFSRWRPSFVFDWEKFKFHFSFGYKLTLSGLLSTIYDNIYNVIIGRFFSPVQLGFYDRASSLRQLPVQTISTALNKVTYPMFVSIQDDDLLLKQTYKRVMQQVLFWVSPLMVLAIIIAEPLFRFVLTEKWLPAVPFFQILCFGSILFPLQSYNLNIVNVKGRSDLFLRLEIIKKVLITILIVCALPFGIYGLLYAQLINSIFSFFINSYYSGKLINYSSVNQIMDLFPTLILSAVAGGLIWLLKNFWVDGLYISDMIHILLIGSIFSIVYFGLAYLFKFSAVFEFKKLILNT